jgi:LPXTG-site transpeptidase (sortase) family protein
MRRSLLIPRIMAGLALLLAVTAGLTWLASPRGDVGDTERVEASLSPSATSSTTSTINEATDTPDDGIGPNVVPPNALSLLQEVAGRESLRPVYLRIESIEVAAPVVAGGVDGDTGLMDVPDNVDEVAWYRYGPAPGEPGSAVLAAHVDLAGQGKGVFFRLREVEPGDEISVEFEDRSVRWFSVEGRVTYLKEELPLDTVFSRKGQPVLTLVTCGGVFSESGRSYDSNIVVYAVPTTRGEPGIDIE